MLKLTQTIGSYCTASVYQNGCGLVIQSKDTDSIWRVYRWDMREKKGACGRGWSLVIPNETHGRLNFSDGRLTEFTDIRGESYGFFYSGDLLQYIATENGPITFDYNADGALTRVCYPDGECVHFSYRDVFTLHDITVSDKTGGVFATSYHDCPAGNIEYIYEYRYADGERVEHAFYESAKTERIPVKNY